MSLQEFLASIETMTAPPALPAALAALWWARKGDWHQAHEVAQSVEDADGAWVHAYLHRAEGDPGNAAYWYARAQRPVARASLDEEWQEIAVHLLAAA